MLIGLMPRFAMPNTLVNQMEETPASIDQSESGNDHAKA